MSDVLPDGTEAKSDKEYVDTWREFARPLKEMLGAELYAFNWGITLIKNNAILEIPHIVVQAVNAKLTQQEAVVDAAKEWNAAKNKIEGLQPGQDVMALAYEYTDAETVLVDALTALDEESET